MPLSLIVLFPLLGFVVNGLFGARLKKPAAGIIASFAVLASFVTALLAVLQLVAGGGNPINELCYQWISVGRFSVDVAFTLDRLSAVMIMIITGVGFFIHLYSVGYMAHDHNDEAGVLYARFFTFLNLFIAFMATLVLADNYLLMFVGWEGVGLCSYFLIGFWLKREDAAEASKKAFIMNRIGDFGFLLGMMLIFLATGSLKYSNVFAQVGDGSVFNLPLIGAGGITLVTMLLFVGACGKSAQVPLFTWLPDAMAGPTPVSALIHAATMVTAGVYMCARSSVLFDAAPYTRLVIVAIGAVTALAAGITALSHADIKKVLAYSTVSQLGFMFMGIGAGAYGAAIFHLFTHAFFKASLFLGAGSVIHALHGEQDMRKMGGLAAKMKSTHITFLLSGLALAGAIPFAGFFSKDEIIGRVFAAGAVSPIYAVCGVAALLAAFVTALYTGRQYAQVFGGTPRDKHINDNAHESPAVMTIPLWVLTIGAVFAGFLGLPHLPGIPEQFHAFSNWLEPMFRASEPAAVSLPLLALGVVLGWGGWLLGRSMGLSGAERAALPENGVLSLDRFYRDAVAPLGFGIAACCRWFDEYVIDGFVNAIGAGIGMIASGLRLTQTSFVRNYAFSMALGAVTVVAYFVYFVARG